jgi:hypothetical protein
LALLRGDRIQPSLDWQSALRIDFQYSHHHREAWSAIYHVYLRTDLNCGLDTVVAILADRHRRTLQRRLRLGASLLAGAMRDLEYSVITGRFGAWSERESAAWLAPSLGAGAGVARPRHVPSIVSRAANRTAHPQDGAQATNW